MHLFRRQPIYFDTFPHDAIIPLPPAFQTPFKDSRSEKSHTTSGFVTKMKNDYLIVIVLLCYYLSRILCIGYHFSKCNLCYVTELYTKAAKGP